MKRITFFGVIVTVALFTGCGGGEEAEHVKIPHTPHTASTAVTTVANTDPSDVTVESVAVVAEAAGHVEDAEDFVLESAASEESGDEFKNPFFAPPAEEIEVIEDLPDDFEGDADVELLGFINVSEPKAIVRIRDQVHTVVEGDTHDQVTVVSIEEDSVRLRRLDQEWQIALFAPVDHEFASRTQSGSENHDPLSQQSTNQNPANPPTPGGGGLPSIPGLPGGQGGGFPELPGLGDIPGAVKGLFGG